MATVGQESRNYNTIHLRWFDTASLIAFQKLHNYQRVVYLSQGGSERTLLNDVLPPTVSVTLVVIVVETKVETMNEWMNDE